MPQSEIIDYQHTPVYTKDLNDKFLEISGGKNAVIGIVSSSSQDDKDSFEYYKNGFLQAGAKEAVWIPIDLALRQARVKNDCDNIESYVASIYGEYDTKRRYPELTDF